MRRRLFAGGLLAAGALWSASSWGADRSSFLPVQHDTLLLEPGKSVACLSQRYVLSRSLQLEQDGRTLVDGTDYVLDADAGCFTLLAPDSVGSGRLVLAAYHSMPLALLGSYRLREDPHRRQAAPPSAPTASPA
ncbi:MAG TPA: hypothetical protein VFP10_00185, partial [Candidatus Eisenbacteria bacterium]|nr:hypothetical protein [Candidatus Eisenbacteria bacterium]